jgi:hypothetical protein
VRSRFRVRVNGGCEKGRRRRDDRGDRSGSEVKDEVTSCQGSPTDDENRGITMIRLVRSRRRRQSCDDEVKGRNSVPKNSEPGGSRPRVTFPM